MTVTNIVILKNEASCPQGGNLIDRASHVLSGALAVLDALVAATEGDAETPLGLWGRRVEEVASDLQQLKRDLEDGVAAGFTA